MWLDVANARARLRGDSAQVGKLALERRLEVRSSHETAAPTESLAVRVRRVRAHGDAGIGSSRHRRCHRRGVAGVTAAGDVAGTDNPEQRHIGRLALAEVRVEIDLALALHQRFSRCLSARIDL